jgi:hypothetical protein
VLRKGASALRNQKATVTQANPLQKQNTNKQQNKTAFSFEKNLYQNSVNSFNQSNSFMHQAVQTRDKVLSFFKTDQSYNNSSNQQSYNNRTEQQGASFERFKSAMLKGGMGRISAAIGLDLMLWYLFLLLGEPV